MVVSRPRRACPLFSVTTNSTPLQLMCQHLVVADYSHMNSTFWKPCLTHISPYGFSNIPAYYDRSPTSNRINKHFDTQSSYFHRNFASTWNIWIIWYAKYIQPSFCWSTYSTSLLRWLPPLLLLHALCIPPAPRLRILFCFLFVLHTASKCLLSLHFLLCSALTGHRWSLALCPTFPKRKQTFLVLGSSLWSTFPTTLLTSSLAHQRLLLRSNGPNSSIARAISLL